MLITLRTLQQHMFKVEIDVNSTVKQLKKKVEEDKGKDYPAAAQKLIYSGKILEDEKKIVDYDIEESKFVVLMVTKSKPQVAKVSECSTAQGEPAGAASSEKPVSTSNQGAAPTTDGGSAQSSKGSKSSEADKSTAEVKLDSQATDISSVDDVNALATEAATALAAAIDEPLSVLQSAESALVTGQDYENMVMEIMKLGFDRDQVERALRVNFNNPDRAVEYLYNGGGAQDVEPGIMEEALAGSETNVTSSSTPLQSATTPSASDNPLDFLRNQLQFQQMRRVIQRNPHVLPAILQQIGTTNPPLLQLISQNQERFVQMINEPVDEGGQPGNVQASQASGLGSNVGSGGGTGVTTGGVGTGGGGGGLGGGGGNTAGGQGLQIGPGAFIQVTPQEKDAIESLKALGFPEGMCIQAYFACEKNEELAANFLLSQNFEEDEQQQS